MIRLAVRCRPELADVVLAELTTLAPNGVEEERGPDYVEYAIYGGEGELPDVGLLEAVAGEGLVEVRASEIPDDWADRWQDFHKPVLVGGRLWLRPSWEPARDDAIDLVVDPGQAFGTGAHPTTRLCLELMLEADRARGAEGPLTDLGTGSGVLAIAASKLGWGPVRGFDHEQAAVESARANAKSNGVEISVERVNLRRRLPELDRTTVANLTAPILLAVVEQMSPKGAPQTLICSGLLPSEGDEVSDAFSGVGLAEAQRRQQGDWAALLMRRT